MLLKVYSVLIFFLLAFSIQSSAMVSFCKGYYIAANGDSIGCTFEIPTDKSINLPIYLDLQKRVKCTDEKTGIKHSYGPKHLSKYFFTFDSLSITFCSIPFGKKNKKLFVRREISGYLTIYDYYSENEARPQDVGISFGYGYNNYGNGMYSVRTGIYQNFIMQKVGNELIMIDGLNFKAAMSGYFNDAPEIADKIKKGEYNKKMIQKIGEEYNLSHTK